MGRPDLDSWRFEVAAGPNAGATGSLADGQHRFGSNLDNDVVLADATLAGHQAVITVTEDGACVEMLAGGGRLRGRSLRPGSRIALRRTGDLTMGGTTLRVHGPRGPSRIRLLAPLALAVPLLMLPPLHSSGAPGSSGLPLPAEVARPVAVALPVAPAPARREPVAAAVPSAAMAAAALRDHLVTLDLAEAVTLAVTDGAIVAGGAAAPAMRDRWLAAQMWFDARFHGSIALIDRVGAAEAEAAAPRLDVRAVAGGAVPYVIVASGDRYTEGAVLGGGWTIESIGGDRIVLRNGTRRFEIGL